MYSMEEWHQDECYDCSKKQEEIKEIKYWIQALVEQLYSSDQLDLLDFENCLSELCFPLGIKMPVKTLTISRKKQEEKIEPSFSNILDEWKEFTKRYSNQLLTGNKNEIFTR